MNNNDMNYDEITIEDCLEQTKMKLFYSMKVKLPDL